MVSNRRVTVVLNKDLENAINGEQKDGVREQIIAVSDTMNISVQNRHQSLLRALSHQDQEIEVRREKRASEAEARLGSPNRQPCKNFLNSTCTKLPCDHWHPPECQFYQSETGCKFGAECSFSHWKTEEQTNKRQKKGGHKSAAAIKKKVHDS